MSQWLLQLLMLNYNPEDKTDMPRVIEDCVRSLLVCRLIGRILQNLYRDDSELRHALVDMNMIEQRVTKLANYLGSTSHYQSPMIWINILELIGVRACKLIGGSSFIAMTVLLNVHV